MAELNVSKKTIKELLDASKADFLIPDYQRPYAWEANKECLTLWEDLFEFAIPNGNAELFNKDTEEYYLGPIVTFKNDENKLEVIDGQQRLTTIMLLLRAFVGNNDVMLYKKTAHICNVFAVYAFSFPLHLRICKQSESSW